MTVRDACNTIEEDSEIRIVWDGMTISIERDNALMMDAFSDYIVNRIHICTGLSKKAVELLIKMIPAKTD